VTRERMYLETMERIFSDTNKIIIDTGHSGPGVVPYLPLTELPAPPARSSSSSSGGTPRTGSSSTGSAQ
jgi:modulator of FtsH protease HflK